MTIHGEHTINDLTLKTRDAIGISSTSNFTITANQVTELLFIEVPMS